MQSFRKKVYLGVAFLLILNLTFLSWLEPIYADTTGETETSLVQEQVETGDASQEANGTSEEAVPVEAIEKTEAKAETEAGTDAVSEGNALSTSTPQGENEETQENETQPFREFILTAKAYFTDDLQVGGDDKKDFFEKVQAPELRVTYHKADGETFEKSFYPIRREPDYWKVRFIYHFPERLEGAEQGDLVDFQVAEDETLQMQDEAEANHYKGTLSITKDGVTYYVSHYIKDITFRLALQQEGVILHQLKAYPQAVIFDKDTKEVRDVQAFKPYDLESRRFIFERLPESCEASFKTRYGPESETSSYFPAEGISQDQVLLIGSEDKVQIGEVLSDELLSRQEIEIDGRKFAAFRSDDEKIMPFVFKNFSSITGIGLMQVGGNEKKTIHIVKKWKDRKFYPERDDGPRSAFDPKEVKGDMVSQNGDFNAISNDLPENRIPVDQVRVFLFAGSLGEGSFHYTGKYLDLTREAGWAGDLEVDSFKDGNGEPYDFLLFESRIDKNGVPQEEPPLNLEVSTEDLRLYKGILVMDVPMKEDLFTTYSLVSDDQGYLVNAYTGKAFYLPSQKILNGRALKAGEFHFKRQCVSRPRFKWMESDEEFEAWKKMIGTPFEELSFLQDEASHDEEGRILWPALKLDVPGRYQYRLWEALPETKDPLIRYDEGQKLVTIEVKEDADGFFTAQLLTDESLVFVNQFLGKLEPETPSGGKEANPSPGGGGGHSNLIPPSEGVHSESPELQLKPIVKEEAEKLIEAQPEVKEEPAPPFHPVSSVVPAQTRLPQTGEGRNPEFYAGVLALLGLGCLAIGFWRRKRSED